MLHHHWIYGDSVDKEEEEVIKMEGDWVHTRRLRGQNGHQVNTEAVAVDIHVAVFCQFWLLKGQNCHSCHVEEILTFNLKNNKLCDFQYGTSWP